MRDYGTVWNLWIAEVLFRDQRQRTREAIETAWLRAAKVAYRAEKQRTALLSFAVRRDL
jgi:hypothetical protein